MAREGMEGFQSYLSGGTTALGGLCRYCLKRSSKACPTVLMTLCASPSQHSRMWQAANRQANGQMALTFPQAHSSPSKSPQLPLTPHREVPPSSPAHPFSAP